MDVYKPAAATRPRSYFMVHGGAWRFGDKDSRGGLKNKARRAGCRAALSSSPINYRMLPEPDALEQAVDLARALAFAQSHARSWGGDPHKFILMGHSAGAHLVSLLSADPSLAMRVGRATVVGHRRTRQCRARCPADNAGGARCGYTTKHSARIPGSGVNVAIACADQDALPLLAVCSSIRKDQPCRQAQAFADRAPSRARASRSPQRTLDHAQINNHWACPDPTRTRLKHSWHPWIPRLRNTFAHSADEPSPALRATSQTLRTCPLSQGRGLG